MSKTLVLVSYGLLCGYAWIIGLRRLRAFRRRFRPSAYGLFWLVYGFYFCFMPFLMCRFDLYSQYHTTEPLYAYSLLLFAVAAFGISVLTGYQISGRVMTFRNTRTISVMTYSNNQLTAFMIATTIGLVYVVSFRRFFAYGVRFYLQNIMNRIQLSLGRGYVLWGIGLPASASYFYLDRYLRSKGSTTRWDGILAAGFACISVITMLILGSRGRMIIVLASLLLIALVHGKVRIRRVILVIAVVLPVTVCLGALRENITSMSDGSMKLGSRWVSDQVRGAFGVADTVAVLLTKWPSEKRLCGSTLLSVLTMPIPRSVYSSKPTGSGPIAANVISPGRYRLGEEGSSGITISLIGEGYINFGAAGIIVVGLAYGALLRLCDWKMQRYLGAGDVRLLPWLILSVGLVLSTLVGEFVGSVAGVLESVIPLAVLTSATGKRVTQDWPTETKELRHTAR